MTRRRFIVGNTGVLAALAGNSRLLADDQQANDPWPKSDLMEPAELAALLNKPGAVRPTIFSVAFPVLYRQKHIVHAEFAGPGGKPEGIGSLKHAVSRLPKNTEIVIYCGCCPMVRCPNIRPAYRALKEANFSNVRVLNIPTNFHTDWVAKGYPVEESLGVPAQNLSKPQK